jgi:hypothetical protein
MGIFESTVAMDRWGIRILEEVLKDFEENYETGATGGNTKLKLSVELLIV